MKITIEIPDGEIKDRLIDVIANQYYRDYSSDRRKVDRVTAECIREIIYKDKERIVDLIVNRASRHMKNLVAKKFVEQLNEEL